MAMLDDELIETPEEEVIPEGRYVVTPAIAAACRMVDEPTTLGFAKLLEEHTDIPSEAVATAATYLHATMKGMRRSFSAFDGEKREKAVDRVFASASKFYWADIHAEKGTYPTTVKDLEDAEAPPPPPPAMSHPYDGDEDEDPYAPKPTDKPSTEADEDKPFSTGDEDYLSMDD